MTAPINGESQKSGQESIPSLNQLYFYLTEGCNLACRHCWLAPKFDPDANRYAVLPVKLFETAIREAKPLGLSGVKLTGGEPLMHPEIIALLEIVRREELALTIETNGILCTPEMAAEIAKSPRRFVSVSMDGADAATHEWVRGVEGSFEQAQQAVRNLAAADTPPQIIMSLMRCNADQMEAMVGMAENLGASSVKFNIVQPTGRGEKMHEGSNGLDVAELIELGRFVDTELSSYTQLKLSFDYPMAFRPLSRIASGNGGGACGILGILGVIPNGHYALCGIGEHLSELVFGTVGEDPLKEVWWENTTLKNLRSGMPDQLTGVCAHCLMKHKCLGTCIAQNYYSTGNLWAPFWFCKQAQEAGLFPDSRIATVKV
jgi:SynChlorMet cassette radical SAM/SPASM protein ScmF